AIEALPSPCQTLANAAHRPGAGGIDEQLTEARDEVVAGGAVDRPITAQGFLAAQDLLHRQVEAVLRPARSAGPAIDEPSQAAQIGAGVGEPIHMIQAQPLNQAG